MFTVSKIFWLFIHWFSHEQGSYVTLALKWDRLLYTPSLDSVNDFIFGLDKKYFYKITSDPSHYPLGVIVHICVKKIHNPKASRFIYSFFIWANAVISFGAYFMRRCLIIYHQVWLEYIYPMLMVYRVLQVADRDGRIESRSNWSYCILTGKLWLLHQLIYHKV